MNKKYRQLYQSPDIKIVEIDQDISLILVSADDDPGEPGDLLALNAEFSPGTNFTI